MNPHCCEFFLTKPAGFIEQNPVPCGQGSLIGPQSRAPVHSSAPHTFLGPGGCAFPLQNGDISVFAGFPKTGPICAFSSTVDSTSPCIFWDEMGHSPCSNPHPSTTEVLINSFNLRNLNQLLRLPANTTPPKFCSPAAFGKLQFSQAKQGSVKAIPNNTSAAEVLSPGTTKSRNNHIFPSL